MSLKQKLTTRLMERCGGIIDIKEDPAVLDEIVNEVKAHLETEKGSGQPLSTSAPFGVPWMDSWVAHHVFSERVSDLQSKERQVASLLQDMVDVQFNARLGEIRDLIREGLVAAPPDGGTPEPGVPPAPPVGPATMRPPSISTASEPGSPPVGPAGARGGAVLRDIDGGVSEPEPPDGGPPEPGVPEPPPGPEPPGGPDAGGFGSFIDNPFILYWFISLKTPMLLDVIDLHISRRLEALQR